MFINKKVVAQTNYKRRPDVKMKAPILATPTLKFNSNNPIPFMEEKQQHRPLGPCMVCGNVASGLHFGAQTCEGCTVSTTCLNIKKLFKI
jgi:hypothetical protein